MCCLQEMAKSRPINMKGQKGFKMLVLNETDRLSAAAQHSLRRTMEKYSASCRLILCCNNVSKVSLSLLSLKRLVLHVGKKYVTANPHVEACKQLTTIRHVSTTGICKSPDNCCTAQQCSKARASDSFLEEL